SKQGSHNFLARNLASPGRTPPRRRWPRRSAAGVASNARPRAIFLAVSGFVPGRLSASRDIEGMDRITVLGYFEAKQINSRDHPQDRSAPILVTANRAPGCNHHTGFSNCLEGIPIILWTDRIRF